MQLIFFEQSGIGFSPRVQNGRESIDEYNSRSVSGEGLKPGIQVPLGVQQGPSAGARLYRQQDDGSSRDSFRHLVQEVHVVGGHGFCGPALGQIIVAFIHHHRAGMIGRHDPIKEKQEILHGGAAETAVHDDLAGKDSCGVGPQSEAGTADEKDGMGRRRIPAIQEFELADLGFKDRRVPGFGSGEVREEHEQGDEQEQRTGSHGVRVEGVSPFRQSQARRGRQGEHADEPPALRFGSAVEDLRGTRHGDVVSDGVAPSDEFLLPTSASSEGWWFLSSGPSNGAHNMALDEALLEASSRLESPVVRTYSWTEPAATFGYFQYYSEVAAMLPLRPLIRRPTGGGLVPHDADWTYSVTVPPEHPWYELSAVESYRRMHQWLQAGFAKVGLHTELAPCCDSRGAGQCFVGAEKYDLLWQGRKLAGAAQRRNRYGLLIQGSVQPVPPELRREDWEAALRTVGSESSLIRWEGLTLDADLAARTEALVAQKYSSATYHQKR